MAGSFNWPDAAGPRTSPSRHPGEGPFRAAKVLCRGLGLRVLKALALEDGRPASVRCRLSVAREGVPALESCAAEHPPTRFAIPMVPDLLAPPHRRRGAQGLGREARVAGCGDRASHALVAVRPRSRGKPHRSFALPHEGRLKEHGGATAARLARASLRGASSSRELVTLVFSPPSPACPGGSSSRSRGSRTRRDHSARDR